jgi:hypothetical protein
VSALRLVLVVLGGCLWVVGGKFCLFGVSEIGTSLSVYGIGYWFAKGKLCECRQRHCRAMHKVNGVYDK